MGQQLESYDISISELLSGQYAFSIPAYQRDYAWSKDEANQLVDDICAALSDSERPGNGIPYFLGTMLFVRAADRAMEAERPLIHQPVDVVDGQQRLITLSIMFAILRDLASAESIDAGSKLQQLLALPGSETEPPRYHLQLRAADQPFFAAAIMHSGASRRARPAAEIGDAMARRNIEGVRHSLRQRFQKEFNSDTRAAFSDFACNALRVLVVSSDNFDYAYQIFLTINDRGKRLSVEDIFRGEILGPLDQAQRDRYSPIIDQMEKYREEAERIRSKDKTFFSHLATIDGWPRKGIIQGLKRAVDERGGPRQFVVEMFAPMAEAYLQVKGADIAIPVSKDAAHWLQLLRWLERHGDDDWVPLAMVAINRYAGDMPALAAFLRALDRYAHGLMALGCGRDARRRHYTPVLRRMLSTGEPLPEPSQLLRFTAADQKQILRNVATRLHLIDPPTAKLFLFRADQAISRQTLAHYGPLLDSARLGPERFTVEHICPKGRLEGGEWVRNFPRFPSRLRASQCIGNLVLATEAQNKKVSQRDFAAKKSILFADGVASPLYLTDMLRSEQEWNAQAIARRYDIIMDAIKTMWSLEGPVPKCPALAATPRQDLEANAQATATLT